jgi:hypothetical protein
MRNKSVRYACTIGLLICAGVSDVVLNEARGDGNCGFVVKDCTTGKLPFAVMPVGTTLQYLNPPNPTNLTSTSYRMFGLGSLLSITPRQSGRVRLTISFYPLGIGSAMNTYKVSYGTGAAPVNGAAAVGTVVGGVYSGGTALAVAAGAPPNDGSVAIDGGARDAGVAPIDGNAAVTPALIVRDIIVTGLALNVACWFDVQAAIGSGNSAVGMQTIEATLAELPY